MHEQDDFYKSKKPILAQCSISIPPENVRKPLMEHWVKMG